MTKSASVILALVVGFLIGFSLKLFPESKDEEEEFVPIDHETLGDVISYTWIVSTNVNSSIQGMFYGKANNDEEVWESSCKQIQEFWNGISPVFLERESGPTFSKAAETTNVLVFREIVQTLLSNAETKYCKFVNMEIDEDEHDIEVQIRSRW